MPRTSDFTDQQRVALRNAFLVKKSRRPLDRSKLRKTEILKVLRRTGVENVFSDCGVLKKARNVINNFSMRPFLPLSISSQVLDKKLSASILRSLQSFESQIYAENSFQKVSDLFSASHQTDTSALMLNVTQSKRKCIRNAVTFCRNALVDLLDIEINKDASKHWLVEEYERVTGSLPLNISLVIYERGKLQGLAEHKDCFAAFGAFVIILRESEIGCLIVDGMSMPDDLGVGSVVFVTPKVLHHVPTTVRHQRRSVLTITF